MVNELNVAMNVGKEMVEFFRLKMRAAWIIVAATGIEKKIEKKFKKLKFWLNLYTKLCHISLDV